jgi:integrase
VAPDSAAHALAHVRALIPEDSTYLRSRATTAALTKALTAYDGGQGTRRKVHSSWSGFFGYATTVHSHFPANPMDAVLRPAARKPPIQFYELDEVERIVDWQPTEARKVVMALLYGTAVEVSVACPLLRLHVLEPEKSVKAAGTKALTRNRVARVDDWAWTRLAEYIRPLLPTAPLFPGFTRWTVSDWHREAVKALKLPEYPLKNARHSWAVRNLRAGVPIHVVQAQLGHGTAKLTLDTYGAFIPSGVDRDDAARKVTEHEAKRRQSK